MAEIFTSIANWNNVELKLETGRLARQADGSVLATLGQTTVLCTAVVEDKAVEIQDFLDMTVFYQERFYAAGKIPGGFVKREGKPTDKESLISRVIDRSLRPIIKLRNDQALQIICIVLSYDGENLPDLPALIGAMAATKLAGLDCKTVAGTRLSLLDEQITINPKFREIEAAEAELFISGTNDAITMIECKASEKSKKQVTECLKASYESITSAIAVIEDLVQKAGVKSEIAKKVENKELDKIIKSIKKTKAYDEMIKAFEEKQKKARYSQIKSAEKKIYEDYKDFDCGLVALALSTVKNDIIRNKITKGKVRIDGRAFDEIREINCSVNDIPKVHGSALFSRGETQVLSVITIGTRQDIQMAEDVTNLRSEKFMLHYNFPPFSVGEIAMMKGLSRREIGHGNLARNAILPILPNMDKYQHTIRSVAEVLECNGSSSMASVCATSLALMDAGIPVKRHVAGIAMGMIQNGKEAIILSDIMGDEDHLGDMDFKLAGSLDGITAIQMDTKTEGVQYEILEKVLDQAIVGIKYIIARMHKAIVSPRETVSEGVNKALVIQIDKESIRTLIGPGGKTIKEISAQTRSKIDIDDNGRVTINAISSTDAEAAVQRINRIVTPFRIGNSYDATVIKVADFGVFLKLNEKTEGFIHVSDLSDSYVEKAEGHLKVGEVVKARMVGFDRNGKVKLTLKTEQEVEKPPKTEQLEPPTKIVEPKTKFRKKRFF